MDDLVSPEAVSFALGQISDGFIFEEFSQQFLAAVIGYKFVPVGGVHDRGIDGLEHVYRQKSKATWIYQSSIEASAVSKIHRTAAALEKNQIDYECLHYVTNQKVPDQDRLVVNFHNKFHHMLTVFDRDWFAKRVNHSPGSHNAFRLFVGRHLHEYQRPGTGYVVSNMLSDPRLYVFLRQQCDSGGGTKELPDLLASTLILFALEDTDPDQKKLKTRDQILEDIAHRIHFDPTALTDAISRCLKVLSKKPRRIRHHHPQDAYCLTYRERLVIQARNLRDAALHKEFQEHSEELLLKHLGTVKIGQPIAIFEQVLHQLFYQQGLEFAEFVLKGESKEAIEKNLGDLVSQVVDGSSVGPVSREAVKAALHIAVREMVYSGTPPQKEFLGRLANTYMMLFLLQVDPKVTAFFGKLAAQLRVYVDNSIIIPALSEYFLAESNRRHWNLLKRAKAAGVELLVEDGIVEELVHHFRMIKAAYQERFRPEEEVFLSNEIQTLYIDEIMIKAYYYAKQRSQVNNFDEFLDHFVDSNVGPNAHDQFVQFLQGEFGIRFVGALEEEARVSPGDFDKLYDSLRRHKSHDEKARTDAQLVLRIFRERETRGEAADGGMLGYRTWWLSKDSLTQRAVTEAFGDRYPTSCYIRPDFLYNYICLAPSPEEVSDTYATLFPSLIGVNISYHLPQEVVEAVQKYIKDHSGRSPGRIAAVLGSLADRLKADPSFRTRQKVTHFLEEQLTELTSRQ